jgi:hypothetical protein
VPPQCEQDATIQKWRTETVWYANLRHSRRYGENEDEFSAAFNYAGSAPFSSNSRID